MHLIIERKYPEESNYSLLADLTSNDAWGFHQFNFGDNLQRNTSQVNYRYSIHIENDTNFIVDSATIYFLNPCIPMPAGGDNVNQIILSPNPARNTLNAFFNPGKSIVADWIIYNDKGQRLLTKSTSITPSGNTTTFDVSSFTSGIYFIKLIAENNEVYTARFVKW